MPRTSTENTLWTVAETAQIIEWLEEPENLRKTKKGSGVSKKQIVREIALRIPTKPEVNVGYKYDNLLKSYRAAVKLNSQSGWGLTMDDLDDGKKTLREKLLSRCGFFFRLDAIFGERPNVRPPALFDSGIGERATVSAIAKLIDVMNDNEEDDLRRVVEDNPQGREEEIQSWSKDWIGMEERENRKGGDEEDIQVVGECETSEEMLAAERETGEPSILLQQSAIHSTEDSNYNRENEFDERGEEDVPRVQGGWDSRNRQETQSVIGHLSQLEEGTGCGRVGRGISKERAGGRGKGEGIGKGIATRNLKQQSTQPTRSSAIRGREKRQLPQWIDDDDDEEAGVQAGRSSKKKKGSGGALVDAVTILASSKTEGEDKKFDFLNRHLLQQGELRREELEIEREKLALERERASAEQKKNELMILQLQASMELNRSKLDHDRFNKSSLSQNSPDS
ncbi:hypothetical protein HOY82DRAFT_534429 [Tuber indicum]|nr:hypothetical protein HOY82DRAFT_534429 [Tuber indicum]